MTCEDNCLCYEVCERKTEECSCMIDGQLEYDQMQNWDWSNMKEHCDNFKDKSNIIEFPLNIQDRENIQKALDSLYLYRILPISCCEDCNKFNKEKNEACQELCDLYEGKHQKYKSNQDWEFMCENCPLCIEKIKFTEELYKEAIEYKSGKIEFSVSNLICFLTKKDTEAKLKELNNG